MLRNWDRRNYDNEWNVYLVIYLRFLHNYTQRLLSLVFSNNVPFQNLKQSDRTHTSPSILFDLTRAA